MLMQIGPVRLALLDGAGAKIKTLILPPPSQGSPEIEWVEKKNTMELVDGSERTRLLGFLPTLTLQWTGYDDTRATGTNDGQTPNLEDLLVLLSNPTGMIRVSPGMAAGGFTADQISINPIQKLGGFYAGVQVTFRGRSIRASRDLEVF